jgi:acyl carrier protein
MQLLNPSWNGKPSPPPGTQPPDPTQSQLRHWLQSQLAGRLELDPQQIEPQTEFTDYGLNSLEAVSLSGELENFLGRRLPPTLLWDYPTLETLVEYLTTHSPSLPQKPPHPWGTPPPGVTPIDAQEAQHLLENIEQLSDAEIEALLERLLSQEEG